MNYEIEKKYVVKDFSKIIDALKKDFGNCELRSKSGFWFADNLIGDEIFLDVNNTQFSKKKVSSIKEIGEFEIPELDFQYIRLRIVNNEVFIVTLKIKNLTNNIEQNVEYEFDSDEETFCRIAAYLKENATVFYYNIKESYEFKKGDLKIELSKFNNLKDAYLEVEFVGENEAELVKELERELSKFESYELKEEPRSYMELAKSENRALFKNVKLISYSKDAIKEMERVINSNKNKRD